MKPTAVCLSLLPLLLGVAAMPAQAYHLTKEVPFPGTEGWDYLAVDSAGGHLFITHGTHVEVLGLADLKPAGAITDTPGVHGVAIADDLGRGFVSAGASGTIVIFDLKTLARVGEVKVTGDNPDAILYDKGTHRVFTFNGRGHNVTAVDARSAQVIGTIPVDAKPEFAVADGAGHIFVNLEDKHSIATLDANTLKVTATWPLEGCEEPSGLALDAAHHRLFSVCSNNVMEIVDSKSGHIVSHVPIGSGVDAAAFDNSAQLAFASGGDGTLTVVKEESPNKFSVVETVKTKSGARTMTLDERTHRLYLATAQRGAAPAPTTEQPHPRPAIVPDTFEVLVLEP